MSETHAIPAWKLGEPPATVALAIRVQLHTLRLEASSSKLSDGDELGMLLLFPSMQA